MFCFVDYTVYKVVFEIEGGTGSETGETKRSGCGKEGKHIFCPLLKLLRQCISSLSGVFGWGGDFPYHFDVLILIRSIKYHLIKKLIAQMETNSRDEIY